MFQQKKQALTWAWRKTHISTPVAITTDVEHEEENGRGHLSLAGVKPGYAGCVSDNSAGIQKKKSGRTAYTLLDMFIYFVP